MLDTPAGIGAPLIRTACVAPLAGGEPEPINNDAGPAPDEPPIVPGYICVVSAGSCTAVGVFFILLLAAYFCYELCDQEAIKSRAIIDSADFWPLYENSDCSNFQAAALNINGSAEPINWGVSCNQNDCDDTFWKEELEKCTALRKAMSAAAFFDPGCGVSCVEKVVPQFNASLIEVVVNYTEQVNVCF